MKRFYPVGYPFWRIFARCGYALKVRVDVTLDEEAGVFVATSRDLRGLVCEAETEAAIKADVERAAKALLNMAYYPEAAPPHVTECRRA